MEFLDSNNEWEEILESELTINDCNEQLKRLDQYYPSISSKEEKEKVWFLKQDIKKILLSFETPPSKYTDKVYPIYWGFMNENKNLLRVCSTKELAEDYVANHQNFVGIEYIEIKLDEDL